MSLPDVPIHVPGLLTRVFYLLSTRTTQGFFRVGFSKHKITLVFQAESKNRFAAKNYREKSNPGIPPTNKTRGKHGPVLGDFAR